MNPIAGPPSYQLDDVNDNEKCASLVESGASQCACALSPPASTISGGGCGGDAGGEGGDGGAGGSDGGAGDCPHESQPVQRHGPPSQ